MNSVLTKFERGLHERFSRLGESYKDVQYKLLKLIPEIERLKVYEKFGFVSIFDYAIKIAGLSLSSVKRVRRLDEKLDKFPRLRESIEKVGINKVEMVSRVITEKTKDLWIDLAENLTKRGLEQVVKDEVQKQRKEKGLSIYKEQKVVFTKEAEKIFNRLKEKMGLKGSNKSSLELILKNFEETLGYVEVDFADSKNSDSTGGTRYISVKNKKILKKRSSGTCEFPNCSSAAKVIHHPERFSLVKNHNNIVHLCSEHHELVHNGVIENELDSVDSWRTNLINNKLSFIDMKIRQKRIEARAPG